MKYYNINHGSSIIINMRLQGGSSRTKNPKVSVSYQYVVKIKGDPKAPVDQENVFSSSQATRKKHSSTVKI